jgi:hypothetical protein
MTPLASSPATCTTRTSPKFPSTLAEVPLTLCSASLAAAPLRDTNTA